MNAHSIVPATIEELAAQLGDIPLERVRPTPPPGNSALEDCIAANESKDHALCELVDGVLVDKAVCYEASVELVWIVDCAHRTVAVYTTSSNYEILGENDFIEPGEVLPGFKVQVRDLFTDLDLALGLAED